MTRTLFLLQGIRENHDHENALKTLFGLEKLDKVILCVAYVRKNGVELIKDLLKKHANRTTVYVGIRNGITSAQGLHALYSTGVEIFAVDTGSITITYHPKMYVSLAPTEAIVITGSANITNGGLSDNIEASTVLMFDRNNSHDENSLSDLLTSVNLMSTNFPQHVINITSKEDINKLLEEGRLEDELLCRPIVSNALKKGARRDSIPRIKLFKRARPDIPKPQSSKRTREAGKDKLVFIWESKGLTERDLNIPTGSGTNPTGSMLLKKGNMDDIDQRSYFREEVFKDLDWSPDPQLSLAHLERAVATFEIVVKGINYGVHHLRLTHNSRTDSRAYEQHNAMTQIHWGKVKSVIAKRDLLGRKFRLYLRSGSTRDFVIEID